ncbi:MAG: 30S ribosomal protein S8 [Candidatus Norongarragalinales archaeon]
MDVLANALNAIKVAEEKGKSEVVIKPASKLVRETLLLLQQNEFIGEFEFVDDGKSGQFVVKLLGKINDCGAIKPRFAVKLGEFEKYEQRFLPARDVGLLVVSTPKGLLTHTKAKEKKSGGRLVAFVY